MSVLAVKRRKLTDNKESSLSEEENHSSSNKEQRSTNGLDDDQKSECEGDQESSGNVRTSRVSGFGRRRKKKVFADYYCDEIFSKPKGGNKKKEPKLKRKKSKGSGKAKGGKKESTEESKKSSSKGLNKKIPKVVPDNQRQTLSALNQKNIGPLFQRKMQGNNSFKPLEMSTKSHEIQKLTSGQNNFGNLNMANMADTKIYPIKPIPQRQGGSKLDLLLSAYRMSNPVQGNPTSILDQNLKKREDKEIDKQVQKLLSNSENPLIKRGTPFGLGSMQNTINAILNRTNSSTSMNIGPMNALAPVIHSDGRKSSSEIEENFKPKTPVKKKINRLYEREEYSSPENNKYKESSFISRKHKPFIMKTPKKLKGKSKTIQEKADKTSRVTKRIKTGEEVRLVLESPTSSTTSHIDLHIGKRNLSDTVNSGNNYPNLNKLLGVNGSLDSMVNSISSKLTEKYSNNTSRTIGSRSISNCDNYRLNSVPLLFASFKN
ncbi:unnamed protein product [Moneuplotes crassus]|uniref:Uncharacterized protein n=1 Tax=Euplotes crassus TaxID=5936 RepID=A0AAD1U9X2_EUPCR|nr:unnamed protein product [Moneuplotes crassus]